MAHLTQAITGAFSATTVAVLRLGPFGPHPQANGKPAALSQQDSSSLAERKEMP